MGHGPEMTTHPTIQRAREILAEAPARKAAYERWREAHQDELDDAFIARLQAERDAKAQVAAEQEAEAARFEADARAYTAERNADGREILRRQWTGGFEEDAASNDVDTLGRVACVIGEEVARVTRQLKLDLLREIEGLRSEVEALRARLHEDQHGSQR